MRYDKHGAEVLEAVSSLHIPSTSYTTAVLCFPLILPDCTDTTSTLKSDQHTPTRRSLPTHIHTSDAPKIASHTVPTPTSTHRQHPLRQLILHTTSPFRSWTSLGPLRSTSYTPSAPLDPVFTIFGSQQLCLGRRKLTDSGGCLV